MTDSTLTTTQKREAIKIAKRKVQLAQEGLIADYTRKGLEGTLASAEAQKAYKAYKKLLEKAEAATSLANTARKGWYNIMGMEDDRYNRYNGNVVVREDKVYLIAKDARNIEAASMRLHNRRTKPSVDEVIESLRKYPSAWSLVDRLEALQEFIEIELPIDMWLSTSDAYNALADIDVTIIGIIEG